MKHCDYCHSTFPCYESKAECKHMPAVVPLVGRLRILRTWKRDYGGRIGGQDFCLRPQDTLQVKVGFNDDGTPMWNDVPIVEEKDA